MSWSPVDGTNYQSYRNKANQQEEETSGTEQAQSRTSGHKAKENNDSRPDDHKAERDQSTVNLMLSHGPIRDSTSGAGWPRRKEDRG